MNDLNDIDEREQDDEDEDDDPEDYIQSKGISDSNIMMRGADGIMNKVDQLKYKKILEKSKMQNHKPTKEHLMFGVIPNWDPKWTWMTDGAETPIKPEKQTREWHIIDHIIKNIHKNESKGLDRDYDDEQTDEHSEEIVQYGGKKKKSNIWCLKCFKQSTNQSC